MCGIAGYIGLNSRLGNVIGCMIESLHSRGPDDSGIWVDENLGVALGHTRLAILDLSPAGHQPMQSACGRYRIVFNGEIYNHFELRNQLRNSGYPFDWRGSSDTETILACFSMWGVDATLARLSGMFAFAVVDIKERNLLLARDRMGEKPLYWGCFGRLFIFGSELKALKAHPSLNLNVNRDALSLYLRHSYVPAPYSIYEGVHKLMPGSFLSVSLDDIYASRAKAYWSFNAIAQEGQKDLHLGGPEEIVQELESTIRRSIRSQMIADVPLGAFLSGGVDSSTVVALMQLESKSPVKTFTIGFDESDYNEALFARRIAQYLGTDHHELYVSPSDVLSVIPRMPGIYCEPFADSSQVPTFLLSRMTQEYVTVALSGDGGDELFGGYNRYAVARDLWLPAQRYPLLLRRFAISGLRALSPASWDKLFSVVRPVLPRKYQISTPGEKARKLADVLAQSSGVEFYRSLTSNWSEPDKIVIGAKEPRTLITDITEWLNFGCLAQEMMAMDARMYLADDILVKIDRAAMAVGLETRVPMLDRSVVEFAWRMPFNFNFYDGKGKWPLRKVVYKYIPRKLLERPKMGFGMPIGVWLRGPLREWAESLLSRERLLKEGYFDPEPIAEMWSHHLSGRGNWEHHLWCVLMFQAWLDENY